MLFTLGILFNSSGLYLIIDTPIILQSASSLHTIYFIQGLIGWLGIIFSYYIFYNLYKVVRKNE